MATKTFTQTDLKAKAYSIGRELERKGWSTMSAKQAEAWCVKRAKEKGVPPKFREVVAYYAMKYASGL